MKACLQLTNFLIIVLTLCSCASKSTEITSMSNVPTQWPYGEKAIHLDLTADTQLNFHGDTPHTLFLCVYQLSDLNNFNQLAGDEDGLYEILECSPFDPSVRSSKRIILNPGEHASVPLYRADGTRYVAVVAGYYALEKEKIIRLFDIPMVVEEKGAFGRTKVTKPGNLNIELALGTQQINTPSQALEETQEVRATTREAYKPDRGTDETTENGEKTIGERIDEVKAAAKKAKDTAETIQKTGEALQKAKKVGETIQKTKKTIPKVW